MKIFLDSADLDEIEFLNSTGIIDGVTTNPSLIKEAVDKRNLRGHKINIEEYIKKILKVMAGKPVSLEVVGASFNEMVSEGEMIFHKFNHIAGNVFVKIPVNTSLDGKLNNLDGLRAITELSKQGIPVNCTLVFSPEQALLAAKAGAKMVSPFVGRLDDFIREKNRVKFDKEDYFPAEGMKKEGKTLGDNGIFSGVDLVAHCVSLIRNNNLQTEVLAASIRNPRQFRECALVGADIITVPADIIQQLAVHKKTQEGMKKFEHDTLKEYAKLMGKKW